MRMLDPGDPWFTPKSHGYGATPKNWKGWAATLGFVALMVLVSMLVMGQRGGAAPSVLQMGLWIISLVALTAAFVWLARRKTDGEWRWRWEPTSFWRSWRK